MLLLLCFLKGLADLPESIQNGLLAAFRVGGLLIPAGQGHGKHRPPNRGDGKGQDHGCGGIDAEVFSQQHQGQAGNEGDDRADVTVGIAHGGNIVHTLMVGDLGKHGVIEHQTAVKAYLGDDENGQKHQPVLRHAQSGAAENAQNDHQQKQRLFIAPAVGKGAADRADDGNQNGGNRACVAPIAEVQVLVDPGRGGQGVKVDGKQGGHQQGKGGIADVVEDPASFQRRELELVFHIRFSLLSLFFVRAVPYIINQRLP